MNLTPGDLWKLRNIALRTVREVHEVLADAARRERVQRRTEVQTYSVSAKRSDPPPAAAPPSSPASDKFAYTIKEASHALGLSRSSIYKLIKDGHLSATRLAGRRLITRTALQEFLSPSAHDQIG